MPSAPGASRRKAKDSKDGFLVVAIGASAGGLDEFRRFFVAMPADSGMAFILVQHLDPSHDSLIAELLSGHTKMKVRQAEEGTPIEPNCVYVIPPGTSLAIVDGLFHMSVSHRDHGVRLPFDFLLRSLAGELGERAVGVVLSGTGADGSGGIRAIKKNRGFIIVQDPDDARFDGMPQNAIATGLVDRVLPVAKIPNALLSYSRWIHGEARIPKGDSNASEDAPGLIQQIIELLRTNSVYDFSLYKRGTLERRIERRMAMSEIQSEDLEQYLELLKEKPDEIDALAKDLLINVTNFFRDPDVFKLLAEKIVPEMLERAKPDVPLRIWSVGCSSGEETYSLVMILLEQISLLKRPIKFQVFASDIDPDAISAAREGHYPISIAANVSPERLARFFTVDGTGYRVSQRLRDSVFFTVQDVLVDPPFSRIDLISCRNLLIYLLPDAQAKVLSLFEFALNERGVLMLGASETLGPHEDRFQPIFKTERIYRQAGGRIKRFPNVSSVVNRELHAYPRSADVARILPRQTFLADLCRRLVLESFAPASVLVNAKQQCIFTLGETEHFLRVVSGHPTIDIFAMAHEDVRGPLREAISRGAAISERIEVEGGRIEREGRKISFNMTVQPVQNDGENFLLICFVESPGTFDEAADDGPPQNPTRVAELESELAAKKIELATALYNVEILTESQMIINDEAMSANEEFQATNEELLTSKEELQSLNEELSALNTQLQETLEQQRRTSNDLQNILYSTDVATIFLDAGLNIRFFTPATSAVFNIIQGDIGRPLSDLSPLSGDDELLDDARRVLKNLLPNQKEVKSIRGNWFNRRVLPYRTKEGNIDGVVISYHDISVQKSTAELLDAARHSAEISNATKTGFLAAASHDLRQPLQTLLLLHGILEPLISDPKAEQMVKRIGTTLNSISSMLNSLLDINRIDAGTIPFDKVRFPIDEIIKRLRDEFAYHAEAKDLVFRVVRSRQKVVSDPQLLEQILRNLLVNAIKFTRSGKILLGCRHEGATLRIEIWDTGVGIAGDELKTIFNEYHQVDAASTEADRGLGLGLAIVKRLTNLLGHRINVMSRPGTGTVFTIEIDLDGEDGVGDAEMVPKAENSPDSGGLHAATYNIVLIDDEPDVLELLANSLKLAGHNVRTARNSMSADRILAAATAPPDIIIADFNLTDRSNGLQLALKFREKFDHPVPIIILTGDISTNTLRRIAQERCLHLHKPASPRELDRAMRRLISGVSLWKDLAEPAHAPNAAVISIVEDDANLAEKLRRELENKSQIVNVYTSSEAFLADYKPGGEQCLILDAYLPGMSGLKLLRHLTEIRQALPTIVITGLSDTQIAVDVMKAGAINFIEKPIDMKELRESVLEGLQQSKNKAHHDAYLERAAIRYASLTPRQVEVMHLVLAGHPNKNIAADLGISQRTVENHRAAVMTKTQSKSLPGLARFAAAVAELDSEGGVIVDRLE